MLHLGYARGFPNGKICKSTSGTIGNIFFIILNTLHSFLFCFILFIFFYMYIVLIYEIHEIL